MPQPRLAAEAGLCLLTAGLLAAALWGAWAAPSKHADQGLDQGRLEALLLALVLLVPAAILAEGALGAALGGLYRQRQAGSCGLALGALALPCTLAGLAAKQHQQYASSSAAALAPAAHQLLASVAASSAALVLLLWRLRPAAAYPLPSYGTPRAAKQRRSSSGTNAQHVPLRLWLPALMLACGALLAASAAAAALAQRSDKLHAVAALLLVAGTAGACTHALLALLPRAFTAGEALVAAQAAVLLGASALQQLPGAASLGVAADAACRRFVVLLSAGSLLAAATLFPLLLWLQQRARQRQTRRHSRSAPITTVAGAAALAVASLCLAALVPAALWALRLAASTRRRRLLMAWWAADLVAALPIMRWLSGSGRLRSILVRKGYHLLAVSLFLPALLLEPALLGVALAGAWAALLAVEALRLSGLPRIAAPIHAFMTSFTDGRDSGAVLVTHFSLLLGMAAPVWLSNALDQGCLQEEAAAAAEAQRQPLWLAAFAGVLILGFGDTAASAVGSLYGRRRLCAGCNKTWEGCGAALAATLATWALLVAGSAALAGGGAPGSSDRGAGASSSLVPVQWPAGGASWAALGAATAGSCLLEGFTTQLDNAFMPLHYFSLLCLL